MRKIAAGLVMLMMCTGVAKASTDTQWVLKQGMPIHTQLDTWAKDAGWILLWQPEFSWLAAADAHFSGDFTQVIEQVINALFNEGQPVSLVLWENNHVAEVIDNAR